MAAVPPGGRVLAVGNGPVFLLAAKTAAKMGYKTTIVSAREELFTQLLWSEAREEPRDPNLTVLGVTRDEDVEVGIIVQHGDMEFGEDFLCYVQNALESDFGADADACGRRLADDEPRRLAAAFEPLAANLHHEKVGPVVSVPKWTRLEVYAPATFGLPAWSELTDVDGDTGTCRSTSGTYLCSPGGARVDQIFSQGGEVAFAVQGALATERALRLRGQPASAASSIAVKGVLAFFVVSTRNSR